MMVKVKERGGGGALMYNTIIELLSCRVLARLCSKSFM